MSDVKSITSFYIVTTLINFRNIFFYKVVKKFLSGINMALVVVPTDPRCSLRGC